MGNDNTHPAPSERLEAYYTGRRTSEIDTNKRQGQVVSTVGFVYLFCFVDIVRISI